MDGNGTWEALVRPSRRLRVGEELGPVRLQRSLGEGRWVIVLRGTPDGDMPLPPYIHEPLADPARYQTVYGDVEGSAAAPTAGLHFTPELLRALDPARVTLHVGLDTFRPVAVDTLDDHELHGERYSVERESWERIAAAERVLAVGTTTVRTLETVARSGELARAYDALHHAGVRVSPGRRVTDELPSAAVDLARARDGVRRGRGRARALPGGDCAEVPVLLVRRRDAGAVT